jgi:hypothetical protein
MGIGAHLYLVIYPYRRGAPASELGVFVSAAHPVGVGEREGED